MRVEKRTEIKENKGDQISMKWMQVTLSINLPNLGSRIRQAREAKKMTPTWVAAQAGMSVANLYRIETEDAKSLPRETLKNLSEAIGIDFDAEVRDALAKEASKKTPKNTLTD